MACVRYLPGLQLDNLLHHSLLATLFGSHQYHMCLRLCWRLVGLRFDMRYHAVADRIRLRQQ